MSIISVRNNETSKWKRNAKNNSNNNNNNKDRKEQGGTEAIVNGWELNDFVVHLS